MKHLLRLLCFTFLLQSSALFAQDGNPNRMVRKANQSLSSYFMDKERNNEKLDEARDLINSAITYEDHANDPKTLILRGDIYNAVSARVVNYAVVGQGEIPEKNPALIAFSSYMKGYANATKNYQRKDIYNGLQESAAYLSTIGNLYLSVPDYQKAYSSFSAVLEIDKFLQSNNAGTIFEDEKNRDDQIYVVAVCASQINKTEEAKDLLYELYQSDYDEPQVYATLFSLLIKDDPEEAEKVLDKGKALFPENINILFAEINYLIQNQEYAKLETKLQEAIEKDPENPSVRSALGNVYMNLHDEAIAQGDVEEAEGYFEKAIEYFNQALSIDSTTFDAIYSIGMMYFNKAAALTQEMQDLGLREQKKYDELDNQVKDLFQKALPYFKKAEKLDPNDQNTLIGLREILARMNQLEDSEAIKARLDAVREGKTFEKSYFDVED